MRICMNVSVTYIQRDVGNRKQTRVPNLFCYSSVNSHWLSF